MIERDAGYETVYGDAMLDEMMKIANIGRALKQMVRKPAGAAKGMSALNQSRLAGSAIGAGLGGAAGATDERDRAGGALRGALLGGVAGLGVGQLASKAGRTQVKHLGQRQLHGLTGYIPRSAAQKARGIGFAGKGMSAGERVQALKGMGMNVGENVGNRAAAIQRAMGEQTLTKRLPTKMREQLARAEVAGLEAQRQAAERGLTSIPGVAKGMLKNPLQTLKTGFVSQGPLGMALAAVPTAAMIPGVVSGQGYGSEYSDRGGVGRLVGENLGYTALGALPFAPMMAGAALAGKAGEVAHKAISKRRDDPNMAGRVAMGAPR